MSTKPLTSHQLKISARNVFKYSFTADLVHNVLIASPKKDEFLILILLHSLRTHTLQSLNCPRLFLDFQFFSLYHLENVSVFYSRIFYYERVSTFYFLHLLHVVGGQST